jgi:hypothetical protein
MVGLASFGSFNITSTDLMPTGKVIPKYRFKAVKSSQPPKYRIKADRKSQAPKYIY